MSPAVGGEIFKRLMPKQNPQRRRIRPAAEGYADIVVICSITIAVKGHPPVVAYPAVAAAAVDVLRRHAAAPGVPVYAWGVRPDPVHLILGASSTCAIVMFVEQVKNLGQREAWRRGIKGTFWQTNVWDAVFAAMSDSSRSSSTSRTTPCGRGSSSGGATTGFQGVGRGLVPRRLDSRTPAGDKPPRYSEAGGGQASALQRRLG